MLNLLIADDHPIVRIGLRCVLETHFKALTLHEADNGDGIIGCLKKNPVDIIIMDINMPDTDPQRTLQTILIIRPHINVIIFSTHKESLFGPMYLKTGAKAFIKKASDEDGLLEAINTVAGGDVYIAPGMEPYYSGPLSREDDNPYAVLTKKEMEVLRHLALGQSMRAICNIMTISSSTASTHKAKIFRKLKLKNLIDLHSITELYPLTV